MSPVETLRPAMSSQQPAYPRLAPPRVDAMRPTTAFLARFASAGLAIVLGACGSSSTPSDGGADADGGAGSDTGPDATDAAPPSCGEADACEPGNTMETMDGCPLGEARRLTCNESCEYEEAEGCAPQTCDAPGDLEMLSCGLCGTQERFCNASGFWEYGTCQDEGECVPGETRSEPCGLCGTQMAQCTSECEWRAASACSGEGECTPGETEVTTSGCSAGEERRVECTSECTLVELEACSPIYDVMLLFDLSAGFNDELLDHRAAFVDEVVTPLLGTAHVGISYFADFPPFDYSDDRPFHGALHPVGDIAEIDSVLGDAPAYYGGGDGPESGVEALHVLSGGTPHPDALPLSCPDGRVGGGCWRPDARPIVVLFTNWPSHNGPDPDGPGLYAPYSADEVDSAAEWPDVRDALSSNEIILFVVLNVPHHEDAHPQYAEMLSDLGLPEATHLMERDSGDWTGVGTALADAIASL